jgi:hypothetical protein
MKHLDEDASTPFEDFGPYLITVVLVLIAVFLAGYFTYKGMHPIPPSVQCTPNH